MSVHLPTTVRAVTDKPAGVRRELLILLFAVLTAGCGVIHEYTVGSMSEVNKGVSLLPVLVYLILAGLIFVRKAGRFAIWSLMIWAWMMMIVALTRMVAVVGVPDHGATLVHYALHVLFVVCQIPLVVLLVRELCDDRDRLYRTVPSRRSHAR